MSGQSRDPVREYVRHTVATLAYRGGKALRGGNQDVGDYRAGEKTRSPLEILAHINDLLDWALWLCKGQHTWHDSVPGQWDEEVARFYVALGALDQFLESAKPLGCPAEKLFQGPIADVLTHVGQIAMLRRLAGSPVRGENYFRAEIASGRVGREQAPPGREFE